jgi:hypothetical protein
MNNRPHITKSQIDDTTFIDLRSTLFRELTEDVIVEIADLHVISTETILKKPLIVNEDHEIKNESEYKNRERLLSIYKNAPSCCDKNCFKGFDKNSLINFAQALDSCAKNEAETALLMNMREHEGEAGITNRGKLRKRQRVMYSVKPFGDMCRKAYLSLWGIGERTLRNLRSYQKIYPGSFAPRIHGNTNKTPSNAIDLSVHRAVVQFINDIGKDVGEESEGRNIRRNNHAVKFGVVRFLPAYYSIALLYRLFLARYQEKYSDYATPLSIRQFYYIFDSPECTSVQLRSPRSDVCDICLLYRNKIRRETGIVNENDENDVTAWNAHVNRAKKARNVYRKEIVAAQKGFKSLISGRRRIKEYIPHASFDFAQNLGLPQLSEQPQELYFASQRSIRLFSVKDDGAGIQYNFLYDEADGGKGGNYVASMLTLFLLDLSQQFKAKRILLNADNCCSQNKNNIVLWVLDLLVMLGIFDQIELKFLVKGHTHCTVDGGHGLIKKEWRKRNIFSIKQAQKAIKECSHTQRAIIVTPNEFYNWNLFLKPIFNKMPGISYQQEFRFSQDHFGEIFYRSGQGFRWQSQMLLKNKSRKLPKAVSSLETIKQCLKVLKAPGISTEKQWDLYKKVRKYVPDKFKDELCPKPKVAESKE